MANPFFSLDDDKQGGQHPILRGDVIEMPFLDHFYRRVQELDMLQQWIQGDFCRIIPISGGD